MRKSEETARMRKSKEERMRKNEGVKIEEE